MNKREQLRNNLNTAFLLLALAGVGLYFAYPENHVIGWSVIAIALLLKVAEFFIRFMF